MNGLRSRYYLNLFLPTKEGSNSRAFFFLLSCCCMFCKSLVHLRAKPLPFWASFACEGLNVVPLILETNLLVRLGDTVFSRGCSISKARDETIIHSQSCHWCARLLWQSLFTSWHLQFLPWDADALAGREGSADEGLRGLGASTASSTVLSRGLWRQI